MNRIKVFALQAFAIVALAGCGYSATRTVTSTSTAYIPPEQTTTTSVNSPSYAPPANITSQVVNTVTRNADGSVTRTSTTYYYPQTTYTSYGSDDLVLASQVRSAMRQDPLVNAHARDIGVGSDTGVIAITGKADSVSVVQQASKDAFEV